MYSNFKIPIYQAQTLIFSPKKKRKNFGLIIKPLLQGSGVTPIVNGDCTWRVDHKTTNVNTNIIFKHKF